MTTLVAGLDISLTGSAIVILNSNNSKIEYIDTFRNKLTGTTRLAYLKTEILHVLYTYKSKLSPIFIEGYGFSFRGMDYVLAELGGILRLGINEMGIAYYDIPPTSLKLFVTGKGNSPKNIMLEQTFRKYKTGSEVLKDDNQVDAFALAQFGITYMKWKSNKVKDIVKKQQNSFKKIKGPFSLDRKKAYKI